jgi:hypothetical protein
MDAISEGLADERGGILCERSARQLGATPPRWGNTFRHLPEALCQLKGFLMNKLLAALIATAFAAGAYAADAKKPEAAPAASAPASAAKAAPKAPAKKDDMKKMEEKKAEEPKK